MNILIIEDHTALREGLEIYLSSLDIITKIHSAKNGKEAIGILNSNKGIDLIITDLNMPEINGFELIEFSKTNYSSINIIVLTMYYNLSIANKLKSLNINAFLTKNTSLNEIKIAIEHINKNEIYLTQEVETLFNADSFEIGNQTIINDNFAKKHSLSKRESEVIEYLIENLSNTEIAEKMFLSYETIKTHRKNIYRKLGVNNVLDLYKLLQSNSFDF